MVAGRSGCDGARRPREGAARASARPGGLGARDGGAQLCAGRPGIVRARRAERPRQRGSEPVAVAADSLGEKVGEGEEVAAELTVGSIWAEKGRERELDGEGRSSAGTAMAAGGGGPIPAGFGRG